MASDPGVIVAYGAATAPSGWVLCDGSSLLRTGTYAALFAAIGTTYGSVDGTHFNVPDMRGRFVLGKSASGTGSSLGETGGLIDHTHTGPSHSHGVDQPADHTAHAVTQPSSHGTLTHANAAVSAHSSLSHSGAALTETTHAVSAEAGSHGTHTADTAHTHGAHTGTANTQNSGANTLYSAPVTHAANATHTHAAHSAHSGSTVDNHALTQASAHSADSHTVSAQPASHGTLTHAGTTVTLAHSHSGMATGTTGSTGTTGTGNPPFQAVTFIIADGTAGLPLGAIQEYGGTAAPTGHKLCDGTSYDTTAEAALFAIIGYTFGGSGANFNVPDLRDRHPLGKATSGTGSTLGGTGGGVGHVHTGPSHDHDTTQANAHGSHTIGQATSHGTLTHSGLAVSDHAALTHSGFAIATHVVGQPTAHGAHDSQGGHTHDAHTGGNTGVATGTNRMTGPATHASGGAHTHTDTHTHSGQAIPDHSITSQNSDHAAQSHSVTQPDSHGTLDHTSAALDAHSAHSGGAVTTGGSVNTGTSDAPYLTFNFIIKSATATTPVGSGMALSHTSVPANALLADGTSYLRSAYPDLFTAIGTAYGSVDGTHFNVPDLRGRIPIGKNAGALGATGGSRDHVHAGGSHTHSVTQPSAHSDHTPTQPTSHGTLTHSGFALGDHAALSHSGLAVASHGAPTQAASHGTHTSEGAHTHDAHTQSPMNTGTPRTNRFPGTEVTSGTTTHTSQGGHTHDAHSAHSGFALTSSTHTVSNQGADHALRSHAGLYTQPDSHGTLTHSGFAVDAHSAHSGFATQAGGTANTTTANPPYITLDYIIQALADAGEPTVLTPDPVAIPVVAAAPTEVLTYTLTPDPTAAPVVATAPTVVLTYAIAPDPVAIPLSVPAPIVSLARVPDPVAVPITATQPTIVLTYNLLPDPVTVTVSTADPTIALVTALVPDPVSIPIVASDPTIVQTGAKTLLPDPVLIPVLAAVPTIVLSYTLAPDATAAPIVAPAPTITSVFTIAPSPTTIPVTVPAPTISVPTTQTLAPDAVAIPIVLPSVTVALSGLGGHRRPSKMKMARPVLIAVSGQVFVSLDDPDVHIVGEVNDDEVLMEMLASIL